MPYRLSDLEKLAPSETQRTVVELASEPLTKELVREARRAWMYWALRARREGGPLFPRYNGLPPLDDFETKLHADAAAGDAQSYLVLRDRLVERHGERAFALLEAAVLENLIVQMDKMLRETRS